MRGTDDDSRAPILPTSSGQSGSAPIISRTPTERRPILKLRLEYCLAGLGILSIALFAILEGIHQRSRTAAGWVSHLRDPASAGCTDAHAALYSDSRGRIWAYPDDGYWAHHGEPPTPALCRYDGAAWTVFTPSNSALPPNSSAVGGPLGVPTVIGEDAQGRIWVATRDEVAVFQGDTSWEYLDFRDLVLQDSDTVEAIAVDKEGNLWIALRSCVTYPNCAPAILTYDGTTSTTYSYRNADLPGGGINALQVDQMGRVWLSTTTGVSIFADQTWATYYPSVYWTSESGDAVVSVAVAESGDAWVYNYDTIALLDEGEWKAIPAPPVLEFPELVLDRNGLPWVASGRQRLFHFDGESWTLRADEWVRPGIYAAVNDLQLDPRGRLWVASNSGVLIVDDSSLTMVNPDTSIVDWDVEDIAFDAQGRAWLATGAGVLAATSEVIEPYDPPRWFVAIRKNLVTGGRWLFPLFLVLLSVAIHTHVGTAEQLAVGLGMVLVLISNILVGGFGAFAGILGAVIARRIRGSLAVAGSVAGVALIATCYLLFVFVMMSIG